MVTTRTKAECIAMNDYECAIYRFQNSPKRNYWWDCIITIYEKCKEFSQLYVLDKAKKTIKKIKEVIEEVDFRVKKQLRPSYYNDMINDYTDYDNAKDDFNEKCYIFEFYHNNKLLFSKVGTTASNTIYGRLKREIYDYNKKGWDINSVNIQRVWNCKSLPAEGLESFIRSEYIKKYPKAFKKNDRFINTLFNLKDCDKIANEYLAMA